VNALVEGRVWVVGDSVDTDAMYPGFAMKLPVAEAARHVFYALRPGWSAMVEEGDILVAGRNFGLGSSRPVALLLRELGIRALVAEQFNSLFMRNCVNFGLPAVTVPGVVKIVSDGDRARVHLREGWVENVNSGRKAQGAGLPDFVLEIIEAGGLLPQLVKSGYLPKS
jgi:3-isopropylmalate/(R)-2-methylmalate dehydratase small subunit